MYVRWQARKRQRLDLGPSHGEVRDEAGEVVYNERGNYLQTRLREDGSVGQDVRWSAVLVESVRVGGRPQQRHLAWLGSITESGIAIVHQRCWFWDSVMERLHQLSNKVDEQDRKRIIEAIAKKVPMPTREEYEACHRDHQVLWDMEKPLPEHGLYELPADFKAVLAAALEAAQAEPSRPAPDHKDEEIARLKARLAELEAAQAEER
jgi:hypothetical protein